MFNQKCTQFTTNKIHNPYRKIHADEEVTVYRGMALDKFRTMFWLKAFELRYRNLITLFVVCLLLLGGKGGRTIYQSNIKYYCLLAQRYIILSTSELQINKKNIACLLTCPNYCRRQLIIQCDLTFQSVQSLGF